MKLYKTTITPTSNFLTTLKGDTLFGHICWAIKFAYGEKRLQDLLEVYETAPFLVVSDAFPNGYLPKPTMPSVYLKENPQEKKENRKKIWLTPKQLQNAEYSKACALKDIAKVQTVTRNAINYKTSTTGGGFDPYTNEEMRFSKQDIYFLRSENFTLDELKNSLEMVSKLGFGKKATIGKGRFEIGEFEEVELDSLSATFMALSPFDASGSTCRDMFYEPFTRFGKSGMDRAQTNAFKKPLLLANSGAVVVFDEKKELLFIGKAITDISTYKDIVHQGYSIVVPLKDIL